MEHSYWKELFGQPAENRVVNTRNLLINEEGPFENAFLKVRWGPVVLEWLLVPNPSTGKESFDVIGRLVDFRDSFVKLMMQWLQNSPSSRRLAFGAILHFPVDSLEKGYQTLASYLPSIELDATNSSDFSYQINRPRKSPTIKISDFKINRLTRWSVSGAMPFQLEVSPDKSAKVFTGKETYSCCLELDINTPAKFEKELPKGKVPTIFKELVELGMEIVKEGDTP